MSGFRFALTLKRPAVVTYTNGKANTPAYTTTIIYASVQPVRPEEMVLLVEARHNSAAFTLFTSSELLAAKEAIGRQADLVVINGENYEIVSCERWQNQVINHFKAVAVRVES